MWERPRGDQVVDDRDRTYRAHHSPWSIRGLLPRRAYHDRAEVGELGRPYPPVARRRRWPS